VYVCVRISDVYICLSNSHICMYVEIKIIYIYKLDIQLIFIRVIYVHNERNPQFQVVLNLYIDLSHMLKKLHVSAAQM